MTDASRIAVVVVNYRSPDLTAAAVRSVLSEPEVLEVVVVDNGSDEVSADYLRSVLPDQRVEIVPSAENLGFGRGVNLGVTRTSADCIFILNSDAVIEPGSLAVLHRALIDERLGAVAPLIVGQDGSPQSDAFGSWFTLGSMIRRTNRRPPDLLDPDWISGVAILFRRDAFESVRGFDTDYFMYLEDVDLCRRLRGEGWTLRRCPSATVVHLGGASRRSTAGQDAAYNASLMTFLRKSGYPAWEVGLLDPLHKAWQWANRAVIKAGR